MSGQKFYTWMRISFQFSIDWWKASKNRNWCSWRFGGLLWLRWYFVVSANMPLCDRENSFTNEFWGPRVNLRSMASKMRPGWSPYHKWFPRYSGFCAVMHAKSAKIRQKTSKIGTTISGDQNFFRRKYFGSEVLLRYWTSSQIFSQIGDYRRKKVSGWQRIAHM